MMRKSNDNLREHLWKIVLVIVLLLLAVPIVYMKMERDRENREYVLREKEAKHAEIVNGIKEQREVVEKLRQQQKQEAAAHAEALERIEKALKESEVLIDNLQTELEKERRERRLEDAYLEGKTDAQRIIIGTLSKAQEEQAKTLKSLNACRVGQDGEAVLFETQVQTGTLKLTYFLYFKEECEKPMKESLKALRDLHEATRGKMLRDDKEPDVEPIDAKTGQTLLVGPPIDRFHASKSAAWLVSFERKNPRGLKEAYEKPVEDQKKLQSVQWMKVHRSGVKVAWYAKASAEERAKVTDIIHSIALQLGCQPTAARWVEDDRKSEQDKSFDILEFGR